MAHNYAWGAFVAYVIGVAFIIASVAVDSMFKISYAGDTNYIGSFLYTDTCRYTRGTDVYRIPCFHKIKTDCTWGIGDSVSDKCSEFNTMRAFQLMGLVFGIAGLFAALLTLVLRASGWRRLFTLLLGEGATAFLIICMITAVSQKNNFPYAYAASVDFHASFALIIVAWIFTGLSSFALFLFNGSKYAEAKSSDGVEFN